MDRVLGAQNFRNSITHIKCNPKNFAMFSYGNIKDTILFYSMSPTRVTWHPQKESMSFDDIERPSARRVRLLCRQRQHTGDFFP